MKQEDRYDSLFIWYANENDITDWKLLKAQVKAESAFDPLALSMAGASGLAQFMPNTFREWSDKAGIHMPNPYNPEHAIACQSMYMRWLMDQFPGDIDKALAAYNFGIGNVKLHRPYPKETTDYVARIKQYRSEY
jgi:soluble lytic murein transglycosylase-like protein